ncbi:MAG: type II secretion system protein GspN [Syntrophales bacterium]
MKLKMNRAIAGYVLAGIAMLLILLYLRFPGEALKDYVKAVAAARYPQVSVSIDAIRPSVPPGLAVSGITVAFRDRPDATLHVDSLTVRPGGLALLRGRLAILMAAEGYGGEMEGQVDFSRLFSLQGPFSAAMNLRDIRIEKCAWLRDALVRQITGTLKGSIAFSGTSEALKNGTGTVDFTLTNGTFPLQESFLGIEKIDFTRVEGKASFRGGAMKITQLTLSGEKLRCSLKGNILLADDLQASQIDLNGTIEFPAQGNKRLGLTISGTLGNAKSRLM